MKSIYKIASVLTLVILIASPMLALASGPGFGSGVDDGGGACAAPVDGGLTMLIAAGLGYGAKRFRKKNQKESSID